MPITCYAAIEAIHSPAALPELTEKELNYLVTLLSSMNSNNHGNDKISTISSKRPGPSKTTLPYSTIY